MYAAICMYLLRYIFLFYLFVYVNLPYLFFYMVTFDSTCGYEVARTVQWN